MSSSFVAVGPEDDAPAERPSTPTAPPYSPVTPTMPFADCAGRSETAVGTHDQRDNKPPPNRPISESDNPDAIALRATLGVLQLQRQRALEHMTRLERQKNMAKGDPRAFATALANGDVGLSSAATREPTVRGPDSAVEAPNEVRDENTSTEGIASRDNPEFRTPLFGDLPGNQDIVRCPPINWAKYHVVGEALDVMHEEQRKRPSSNHAETEDSGEDRPEHVIAAPYNPWSDRLDDVPRHPRHEPSQPG